MRTCKICNQQYNTSKVAHKKVCEGLIYNCEPIDDLSSSISVPELFDNSSDDEPIIPPGKQEINDDNDVISTEGISIQQELMLKHLSSLNINTLDDLKTLLSKPKRNGPIKQRNKKPVQEYIMDCCQQSQDTWFSKNDIGQFSIDENKTISSEYKSYKTYIHYLVRQNYLTIESRSKNKKYYKFNKPLDNNYSNKYCHKNPIYKQNNNNN